jgi:antitoxin VapB
MVKNVDDDNAQDAQGAELVDRLLRIGRDCEANLKEPYLSADHGTILYDDRGLPPARQ